MRKQTGAVRAAVQESNRNKAREQAFNSFTEKFAAWWGRAAEVIETLPCVFSAAVIILFVRLYSYSRSMDPFYVSDQTGVVNLTDQFSHCKAVAIMACACVMIAIIIIRLCTKSMKIRRTWLYIPMGVYCLMVILSCICSEWRFYALWGANDRFEGTLVLLSYMVILFYTMNTIDSRKKVRIMLCGLGVSLVILGTLGLSQARGEDFFETCAGQKFIIPNTETVDGMVWDIIDRTFEEGSSFLNFLFHGIVYESVYNPNYVSFYLALIVPFLGMLTVGSIEKLRAQGRTHGHITLSMAVAPAIWSLLLAVSFYCQICSTSMGGLIGLAVAAVAALILFRTRLVKWWISVFALVAAAAIVLVLSNARWFPEVKTAVTTVIEEHTVHAEESETGEEVPLPPPAQQYPYLDYIEVGDQTITFSINEGDILNITPQFADGLPSGLLITDGDGQPVPGHYVNEDAEDISMLMYALDDPRYYDYMTISVGIYEDDWYVYVDMPGADWQFIIDEQAGSYYRHTTGKLLKLHQVPHVGFKDNPHFGSGRGYIWSCTIPMLRDTIFLGHGADTFLLYYPNDDVAYKYNLRPPVLNSIYVDKPHNLYLGVGVDTGCVSLAALLVLYAAYLIESLRIYWKQRYTSSLSYIGAGIFLGTIGFLAAAMINDSSVSVMPLFYTLLGMGFGINQMVKNNPEAAD